MACGTPAEVTDEQFRLLCLLHLTEEAMRETLAYFVINQTLTRKGKGTITTDANNAEVALADILNFIPPSSPNPKKPIFCLHEIETHFHRTSTKVYNAIFTFNSSPVATSSTAQSTRQYTVNPTIDFNALDISSLYYFLTNMNFDFLPTRKALFRKKYGNLVCQDIAHSKKCCALCEASPGNLHGKNNSPCKNCSTSHYQCYNDHTPCCVQCMNCDVCATTTNNVCPNRKLRHAINFLHNVRNLNAHSNIQTYNDLKAGNFTDEDFPGCTGWNTLWSKSSTHLLEILEFQQNKAIIDHAKYYTKCNEIKNKLPNQTKDELSELYGNALLGLCDDLKSMLQIEISELKETVHNLEKNVQDLTQRNMVLTKKLLPLSFNIKFLICADVDSCWTMVNNFLGFQKGLTKEDFSVRSDFSRQLMLYIKTIVAGFLASGSIMVSMDEIRYDDIEKGYLYQFVVSPSTSEGSNIPEEWLTRIQEDEQGRKSIRTEIESCIQNAIHAERKVKADVHVINVKFGSLVFFIFIDGTTEIGDSTVDLAPAIETSGSQFSQEELHVSAIKRLEKSSYKVVSCNFHLNVIGTFESLHPYIESGMAYLQDQVCGPPYTEEVFEKFLLPQEDPEMSTKSQPTEECFSKDPSERTVEEDAAYTVVQSLGTEEKEFTMVEYAAAPTPYTPGGTSNTQQFESPVQQVELKISCRHLVDMDFFSKSELFVVVYTKTNTKAEWRELGRTETIMDNLNPDFVRSFKIDYVFEEQQYLKFDVYGLDANTHDLSQHDFIGRFVTTLGAIVGENNPCFGHLLQEASEKDHDMSAKYARKSLGTIIIRAEEVSSCKDHITLSLYGRKLDKMDFFGKCDPYLEFQRCNEDNTYSVVHRTEVIKNTLNPDWKPFTIHANVLCNGDYDRNLRVLCFDRNTSKTADLIGQFEICMSELKNWSSGGPSSYDLINPKKKAKKSKYKNSGVIHIRDCKIVEQATFLDYIRGGLELNLVVAIDFTASNGNPSDPNSLHHNAPHAPSQYLQLLQAVGAIIEDYNSDKLFPAFGFGAKLPPVWNVSHEFALNFNPQNPDCKGIEGIIAAYHHTINNVQLYGPTNFSPVINSTSQIARHTLQTSAPGLQYFVLLIITDGIISDMEKTKEAIVAAASLPISIIIVGVGQAEFDAMEELDGDEVCVSYRGRAADRDIVQFVPFRDYMTGNTYNPASGVKLAKDVLQELPDQVTEYMMKNRIKANPPGTYW